MSDVKTKSRGLGRGLNALFEDEEKSLPAAVVAAANAPTAKQQTLGVDQIKPGSSQPRKDFDADALNDLAESIKAHGLLQPLLVRKAAADGYEIIAGERRWRAAQKAKLHEVPVIILDLPDEAALEVALIENLQREDLNPLEEAQGYQRLADEYGHTQEKIAKALGKSRPHVANMMRLLTLPEKVQHYLREGQLSAGHARALITAENPQVLAEEIVFHGLNVRETESLAARDKKGTAAGLARRGPGKDVDTMALEQEMTNLLGMKVRVDSKAGGKGTLKIEYKSLDQLDEVLAKLSGGGMGGAKLRD